MTFRELYELAVTNNALDFDIVVRNYDGDLTYQVEVDFDNIIQEITLY